MHQFGGDIRHGDIQLLLAAISDDKSLFQKLDRQSKDVLRRLQSHTPDRIRVSDLAKLENELGIDLFGMLAVAEGVSSRNFETSDKDPQAALNEARLISLFVKIVSWFRALQLDSTEWLSLIRADTQQALERATLATLTPTEQ
jgi:hypothetical protein